MSLSTLSGFNACPEEVVLEVAKWADPATILALMLTSQRCERLLLPELYTSITIRTRNLGIVSPAQHRQKVQALTITTDGWSPIKTRTMINSIVSGIEGLLECLPNLKRLEIAIPDMMPLHLDQLFRAISRQTHLHLLKLEIQCWLVLGSETVCQQHDWEVVAVKLSNTPHPALFSHLTTCHLPASFALRLPAGTPLIDVTVEWPHPFDPDPKTVLECLGRCAGSTIEHFTTRGKMTDFFLSFIVDHLPHLKTLSVTGRPRAKLENQMLARTGLLFDWDDCKHTITVDNMVHDVARLTELETFEYHVRGLETTDITADVPSRMGESCPQLRTCILMDVPWVRTEHGWASHIPRLGNSMMRDQRRDEEYRKVHDRMVASIRRAR
ncbi:hypothetical protein HGRIS_006630 [Hohenbuehelia grisea]|uniref:F-box domain-containing protein n=1 Tax=Hohenbuehelia grisea TaxID=104357 RepID=A0ABR3JA30_9AGAR